MTDKYQALREAVERCEATAADFRRTRWPTELQAHQEAMDALELLVTLTTITSLLSDLDAMTAEIDAANVQAQRQAIALEDAIGERAALESEVKRLRGVAHLATALCARINAEGGHGYTVHGLAEDLAVRLDAARGGAK